MALKHSMVHSSSKSFKGPPESEGVAVSVSSLLDWANLTPISKARDAAV